MHKKILLCLCCIFGLVALPCTNAHALLGLLGELDAHMSEFNPIGHHLIDPINEAVPRLHIK
ncbi:MAG: hypothetical protein GY868_19530, partial [Deltaproteobacteria bacterium]|nr:hypothetical protein [Deltaproteobacteria bacterium]